MKIRNVNVNRAYELDDDLFAGFKDAAATQRPMLAMQYLVEIIEAMSAKIAVLENRVMVEDSQKSVQRKKVVKEDTKDED